MKSHLNTMWKPSRNCWTIWGKHKNKTKDIETELIKKKWNSHYLDHVTWSNYSLSTVFCTYTELEINYYYYYFKAITISRNQQVKTHNKCFLWMALVKGFAVEKDSISILFFTWLSHRGNTSDVWYNYQYLDIFQSWYDHTSINLNHHGIIVLTAYHCAASFETRAQNMGLHAIYFWNYEY